MRIEQFEDIEAWQLARELTREAKERKVTLNSEPVNAYGISKIQNYFFCSVPSFCCLDFSLSISSLNDELASISLNCAR